MPLSLLRWPEGFKSSFVEVQSTALLLFEVEIFGSSAFFWRPIHVPVGPDTDKAFVLNTESEVLVKPEIRDVFGFEIESTTHIEFMVEAGDDDDTVLTLEIKSGPGDPENLAATFDLDVGSTTEVFVEVVKACLVWDGELIDCFIASEYKFPRDREPDTLVSTDFK